MGPARRTEQDRLEDWLRGALRNEPAPNNWYLFPMTVAAFLDEVGRGDAETARALDRALDLLEGWYRGDGWYTDGDGRAFDHYIGWAMHLYPVLVAHLRGDTAELERLGPRLREFLTSFAATFDGDGAPLHQGRSLTYRFATLSAVALGEVVGWTPLRPGQTRRILSARAALLPRPRRADRRALLPRLARPTRGRPCRPTPARRRRTGPARASSGCCCPVGAAVDGDRGAAAVGRAGPHGRHPARGWLVQTTQADGLVRLHNHGSDHMHPWHADGGEPDPLYARLAYSTRTGPTAVRNAADNHIALHVRGRESVRRRIHPIGSGPEWVASWHQPQFPGPPAFPGGPPVAGGPVLPQSRIESLVVARGAWEVHIHRLRAVPGDIPVTVTGWALAAATPQEFDEQVDGVAVALITKETATRLVGFHGFDTADGPASPAGHGLRRLGPRARAARHGRARRAAGQRLDAHGSAGVRRTRGGRGRHPGRRSPGQTARCTTCAWVAAIPEVTTS